ncbi:hypothetical protein Q5752_004955 [Cryptotrichosporon argae]
MLNADAASFTTFPSYPLHHSTWQPKPTSPSPSVSLSSHSSQATAVEHDTPPAPIGAERNTAYLPPAARGMPAHLAPFPPRAGSNTSSSPTSAHGTGTEPAPPIRRSRSPSAPVFSSDARSALAHLARAPTRPFQADPAPAQLVHHKSTPVLGRGRAELAIVDEEYGRKAPDLNVLGKFDEYHLEFGLYRNILLGSVPDNFSEHDLREDAGQYGRVVFAIVERRDSASRDSWNMISDLGDVDLDDVFAIVMFQHPVPARLFKQAFQQRKDWDYRVTFAKETYNLQNKALEDSNSSNLYVSSLPLTMDKADITDMFQQVGIKAVSINVNRDNCNNPRGSAMVRVESHALAQKAIRILHGTRDLPDAQEVLQVRIADSSRQQEFKNWHKGRSFRHSAPVPRRHSASMLSRTRKNSETVSSLASSPSSARPFKAFPDVSPVSRHLLADFTDIELEEELMRRRAMSEASGRAHLWNGAVSGNGSPIRALSSRNSTASFQSNTLYTPLTESFPVLHFDSPRVASTYQPPLSPPSTMSPFMSPRSSRQPSLASLRDARVRNLWAGDDNGGNYMASSQDQPYHDAGDAYHAHMLRNARSSPALSMRPSN